MNPTITTEELLALTKSADLLRRTAEKAMRFDEAERLLTEHIRSWERLQNAMPEPDINDTPEPLVKRVAQRLNLVDALKEEVVTAGNHAACRLNVLGEIHRILGSDGGTTGVCALTGVPPQLYRLPKRVEQLVGELHGTRNDRDHLAGILEKVARACDGDDPLDFPQLPQKVAELAKEAAQCQQWRDEFVKAENKASRAEERANSAGLQLIALDQEVRTLRRENETLARNMPPEPPMETAIHEMQDRIARKTSEAWRQDRATRVTKVIGQVWCRGNPSVGHIGVAYPGGRLVLCEVHQDVQTRALTYHPVAVKDLPLVQ